MAVQNICCCLASEKFTDKGEHSLLVIMLRSGSIFQSIFAFFIKNASTLPVTNESN